MERLISGPQTLLTLCLPPQEAGAVLHHVLQQPSELLQEPVGASAPPETLGGEAGGTTV